MHVGGRFFTAGEQRPTTTFHSGSGYQLIQLKLSFNKVPSIFYESMWIIGTLFLTKIKILQLNSSQTEPYFELTISNSYS